MVSSDFPYEDVYYFSFIFKVRVFFFLNLKLLKIDEKFPVHYFHKF